MSGVALITRDTPVGRHMAFRLDEKLRETDDPLDTILLVRKKKKPIPLRYIVDFYRKITRRFGIASLVTRYEIEAKTLFFQRAGPPPDWPSSCTIRQIPDGDVNASETADWIATCEPSLIVLVGTPIIKKPLLRAARIGVLNLHGSMLPHYRGAHVEFWQVVNRDLDKIGLTIHHVEAGVDTGDIVLQVPQAASISDGPWIIRARNQLAALEAMPDAVCSVLAGTAEQLRQPVTEEERTYRASDVTPAVIKKVIATMSREPRI